MIKFSNKSLTQSRARVSPNTGKAGKGEETAEEKLEVTEVGS